MRRREILSALGAATVAWPLAVRAQQAAMPVVGFINSGRSGASYPPLSAFLKGLGEAGFVEGTNVVIEYRWAEGQHERLPALLADLVQRKVNVIAATSTPAAVAAREAKIAIPIVFTTGSDPVKMGFVSSLARPGGNITGATSMNLEVAGKRLELMHELLPTATNIALLINPADPVTAMVSQATSAAAAALGLKLHVLSASNEQDLATGFKSLVQLRAEALVIATATFFNTVEEELGKLSASHRMPAIFEHREFTAAGGLMSYSGDLAEAYRLAGVHVGRILNGGKPADLPVQQITKVNLYINLKTANALGIVFPLSLLGRADEVIE